MKTKTIKTTYSVTYSVTYPVMYAPYKEDGFLGFFLDEKESLKGTTVFDGKLVGCLHTSSIAANSVNTLRRVSFSARGF